MNDTVFAVVLSANCIKMNKSGEIVLLDDKYYPFGLIKERSMINQDYSERYPALKIQQIAYASLRDGDIRPQRYYGNFPCGDVAIAVFDDGKDVHIRLVWKNAQNTMHYDPEVDFADFAEDCGWSENDITNITSRLIGAYRALYADFDAIQRLHYPSDQRQQMAQLYKNVQEQYLDTL